MLASRNIATYRNPSISSVKGEVVTVLQTQCNDALLVQQLSASQCRHGLVMHRTACWASLPCIAFRQWISAVYWLRRNDKYSVTRQTKHISEQRQLFEKFKNSGATKQIIDTIITFRVFSYNVYLVVTSKWVRILHKNLNYPWRNL